jgi:hypothetical protein
MDRHATAGKPKGRLFPVIDERAKKALASRSTIRIIRAPDDA